MTKKKMKGLLFILSWIFCCTISPVRSSRLFHLAGFHLKSQLKNKLLELEKYRPGEAEVVFLLKTMEKDGAGGSIIMPSTKDEIHAVVDKMIGELDRQEKLENMKLVELLFSVRAISHHLCAEEWNDDMRVLFDVEKYAAGAICTLFFVGFISSISQGMNKFQYSIHLLAMVSTVMILLGLVGFLVTNSSIIHMMVVLIVSITILFSVLASLLFLKGHEHMDTSAFKLKVTAFFTAVMVGLVVSCTVSNSVALSSWSTSTAIQEEVSNSLLNYLASSDCSRNLNRGIWAEYWNYHVSDPEQYQNIAVVEGKPDMETKLSVLNVVKTEGIPPHLGVSFKFIARFSGYILPPVDGDYELYSSFVDDYFKLTVDNQEGNPCIEKWWHNNLGHNSCTMSLQQGRHYSFVAIFIESGGSYGYDLRWKYLNSDGVTVDEVIPEVSYSICKD